jgi:glycosyltransferase involved in cell wall biosynthesis
MNVLEVTHRYQPRTGGVEERVQRISEGLVDRGHEVTVLSFDRRRGEPKHEWINGVHVKRRYSFAPGGNFHINPVSAVDPLLSRADVIHVHNYHSLPSILTSLGALGSTVVFTPPYHDISDGSFRNYLLKVYQYPAKAAFRNVDEVICVSEWAADRFNTAFPNAPEPSAVEHGLDYTEPPGLSNETVRLGDGMVVIGRVEEYKNIEKAVDVAKETDRELTIVGDGPYLPNLESYADRMGVSDRVEFKGHVSEEEKWDILMESSVSLHLSEIESFGMTVGESLAAGTPAVVHSKRGLKRWSDTNGVKMAKVLDSYTLSAKIEEAEQSVIDRKPLPEWREVVKNVEGILDSEAND